MKKTILLIPGNPAVASYYQSWIREIESCDGNLNIVYATSYVLFDRKLNYIKYDNAMRKHYEEILLALSTSEKITIIAHSVGSYFALNLLEKYPEKIERVIVMFPYTGYSTIKSLRFVWPLYWIDRHFPLVELVARWKNLFKIWEKDTINITNRELTANLRFGVRQCTYFNNYEFNIKGISQYKDKIYFIYKNNDRWCPISTIELLKPISHYKEVNIRHEFIIDQVERNKMTAEIMPLLNFNL